KQREWLPRANASSTRRLQVFQDAAERGVDRLGEVAHERRDLALVHGGGDGDGVGDEQPDGRRRQDDADDRDQCEQADPDTLHVAHRYCTSSTIFPNCSASPSRRCAAAASASGKTRSIAGRSWPAKNKRAARSSSPLVPMYEPRIESRFANSARRSSDPWYPVVAPQVTSRPPRASERTLCGQVASPTC